MEGPVGQKVKRERRRECGHEVGEKEREKKLTLTEMFAGDKRCWLSTGARGGRLRSPSSWTAVRWKHLAKVTGPGYAMLAFGVFVYEACETEEVRLCGGR